MSDFIQTPNKCCGTAPIVWKCEHFGPEYCGCDVEKIECPICGNIIYGADAEEVSRWNAGDYDD